MILINLNNQEMQLKYDVNAVCELEAKSGKGLFALLDMNNLGFNFLRLLLWAGLRHSNKAITPDIVGTWMHNELTAGKDFNFLFEKVQLALEDSGILGKKTENVGEINPTPE